MAKRVSLDLELPDELLTQFPEKEIQAKAREALVMELLREHRLSQGKAAEVLVRPDSLTEQWRFLTH